jgi:FixJ family two-component response regulator
MATAAITGSFEGKYTNPGYLLGRKPDSPANSNTTPIVFLISDGAAEESLKSLIVHEGWQFETFSSAQEFLARPRPVVPSCLILTLSERDLHGLETQKRVARERGEVPIILVADYGDVSTTVQAMKAGAVDFLVKPFSYAVLLGGIRESLERSRVALDLEMEMNDLRSRYASLTPRERQVMAGVVSGLLNKQVGGELGISEITVKAHRGQVMQKMKASSLADLVRMAGSLGTTRNAIYLA